jgi:predicted RNase H-like nuclease
MLDGHEVSACVAATIAELVAMAETSRRLAVVAIDIPIGLPDDGRREADRLAREIVGPQWRSVFMTPARAALQAGDHAEAVRLNRDVAQEGTSVQAFSLRKRIFEVERWARAGADTHRVVEVHPEVSFATMAGAPLAAGKTTWAGAERRRHLLADNRILIAGELGSAGAAARVDDVLDAAAAAWSALRVAAGDATHLPDPPQRFSDGWPCAISI